MIAGEDVLEEQGKPAAVGLVFQALAAFVLDDVALVVQLFLGEGVSKRRDPVGLEPQEQLEVCRRRGHEVIRAVVVGGPVDAAFAEVRAGLLGEGEVLARRILRSLEHEMLEQMREACPAASFVLGSDVEPLVHVNDGELAIDMQDDLQAVRQSVFFEIDLRQRTRHGLCRRRRS